METKINIKKNTIVSALKILAESSKSSLFSCIENENTVDSLKCIKNFFKVNLEEAMAIAVMFFLKTNSQETYVEYKEIGQYLGFDRFEFYNYYEIFKSLEMKEIVEMDRDRFGRTFGQSLALSEQIIQAICNNDNKLILSNRFKNIDDVFAWVIEVRKNYRKCNNIEAKEVLDKKVERLLKANCRLPVLKSLKEMKLPLNETVILLAVGQEILNSRYRQPDINLQDILNDLFPFVNERLTIENSFLDGYSFIMLLELMKFETGDFADLHSMSLTELGKEILLQGIIDSKKKQFKPYLSKLIKPEEIKEKKMFYNPEEKDSIDKLNQFIAPKNYNLLIENLNKHKLKNGLTILLYGAAGAGKTETVYQLARQTNRHVLMVDISKIRDKFVGETEKNLKMVFCEYENACEYFQETPILLFNESDALISKRIEIGQSIDQMHNNMQNILLQQLEDFKGIFISTTNLTQNLDVAFERRFLYKIKFNPPNLEVRKNLWENRVLELLDCELKELSIHYPLSGGQIDNVVTKANLNAAIFNTKISLNELKKLCEQEALQNIKTNVKIGFGKN